MLMLPSLISTVLSAFTKVATTVGPMLAKYVPVMIEAVGKNLPKIVQTIEAVSQVANILAPNERAVELGEKAIAAEKTPEDFAKINDYINYLRKEVKVDVENISQDPVDINIRNAIGAAIALKGVSEMLGIDLSLPFLTTVTRLELEPKLIMSVISAYAQCGLKMDEIGDYLDDKLSLEQAQKHSKALVTAYQLADPQITLEKAEDAVINLR